MKKRGLTIFLLFICVLGVSGCNQQKVAPADMVLIHAKIYTVNPKEPWAQAMAVREGKIITVGSDKAINCVSRSFDKSYRCERAHGTAWVYGCSCPHHGGRCHA